MKSLRFKPRDPLGVPKPVMLEGDVSEGPQYKLADVSFLNNHAFPEAKLRQQFPLKKGALMERGKVASGLESLRKLYGTRGYLDYVAIPETHFGSNATVMLNVTIEEGPQYHMGALDIVADKELAGRLGSEWKLAERSVYDNTYIDEYLTATRDILPSNFSRANVETTQNCPEAGPGPTDCRPHQRYISLRTKERSLRRGQRQERREIAKTSRLCRTVLGTLQPTTKGLRL